MRGYLRKYHNIEGQVSGRQPKHELGSFMEGELETIRRNHWEHHAHPL